MLQQGMAPGRPPPLRWEAESWETPVTKVGKRESRGKDG